MRKKNVFWGLLLILAAVLIILNQFGVIVGVSMFDIVVTIIMVGIIIKSITTFNFWGILFPLAVICIVFAEEWNITEFTPWPALLTAFLCSIGLSLIFQRPQRWFHHSHHDHVFSNTVINEQDKSAVSCSTSFGSSIKYINSENFEKANISCSFGEMKVYFDNAQIPSGKAFISLDVSFGEATLFIPKTWKVVSDVNVFLGDMGDNNRKIESDSPIVTIRGNVSFGEAKIIYV